MPIRSRRAGLFAAVFACVLLSAPVSALGSHPAGDGHTITCHAQDGLPELHFREPQSVGRCDSLYDGDDPWGDTTIRHTITITRPPERGLAFVEEGTGNVLYVPLRSGPDSFTFVGSDETSQDEATVTTINRGSKYPVMAGLHRTLAPSRKGVFHLEGAHCPAYPSAPNCRVGATVKAKIRLRGKRRTVTLGKGSRTVVPYYPGPGHDESDYPGEENYRIRVKLTTAARALLRKRGQIKGKVFVTGEQLDPRGRWEAKHTMRVTLFKR